VYSLVYSYNLKYPTFPILLFEPNTKLINGLKNITKTKEVKTSHTVVGAEDLIPVFPNKWNIPVNSVTINLDSSSKTNLRDRLVFDSNQNTQVVIQKQKNKEEKNAKRKQTNTISYPANKIDYKKQKKEKIENPTVL